MHGSLAACSGMGSLEDQVPSVSFVSNGGSCLMQLGPSPSFVLASALCWCGRGTGIECSVITCWSIADALAEHFWKISSTSNFMLPLRSLIAWPGAALPSTTFAQHLDSSFSSASCLRCSTWPSATLHDELPGWPSARPRRLSPACRGLPSPRGSSTSRSARSWSRPAIQESACSRSSARCRWIRPTNPGTAGVELPRPGGGHEAWQLS
mmetsp:Transcript_28364/g.88394  ORF Transcript_28364/g.88394 Transcript_28364/m.88394 type:complete len:209 (+) Transcript_28364:82-708(+)